VGTFSASATLFVRRQEPLNSSQDEQLPESDLERVEDDEAVARVLAGDLASFELLMRRNNRRLFRAARSILRSDDEAEDVMQHAYLLAFEHLSDYQGRSKFAAWLTRIAIHEAFRRLRQQRRLETLDEGGEDDQAMAARSPEQHASDEELRVITEAAIDALPCDFRTVFVLRAVEQLSVADVAESLEIPEDTVKTRFFRARQRLRKSLLERLEGTERLSYEFHLTRCDRVVGAVLRALSHRKLERVGP
jgi:RNA polymerase sigma-70 factor, ECF subfamily